MRYQVMNNDNDMTNPVIRGVSLLDDTTTVNYTSDGETATSTLASDDPFSLLHTHESYRDNNVHSNLFGITDDDSSFFGGNTRRSTWSHTNTASYSNAGSSYEEMPFMASISNNNNTNNNSININDYNDNDNNDRGQENRLGMMGQNEQPSAP